MKKRKVGTVTLAASLIAAGVVLFAQNFIDITIGGLFKYWPVLLIALGIEMLIVMVTQRNEDVKISIDGFCIAFIIVVGIMSNSATFINFDFPFEFNFNGDTIMEGIRYNTSIKEEIKKDNISSSYTIDTVKVTNPFGNVRVEETSESSIRIEASMEIKCNDEEKAKEYAQNAIVINEGNTTEIYTREISSSERHDYSNAKINYVIFVPQNVKVEIYGSHGDIDIDGINGNVEVDNKFGETRIKNIGGDATVNNSFGQIVLNDIKGEVVADNSNGRISVNNIQKSADLETAFGEIDVEKVMGGLTAISKNGRITAKNITGKVEVESYFGSVAIEDVTGNVIAKSKNGEVKAERITGDTRLETDFGAIKLDSENVNNADIYAETKFGSIDTDLQLNKEKSGSKVIVKGNIGSGQYKIELITSNGSIDIQ
jgi:hypothetical protein